jgi:hypothetical protein
VRARGAVVAAPSREREAVAAARGKARARGSCACAGHAGSVHCRRYGRRVAVMSLPRIEVLKFLDKIYDKPHSGVGFTLLSRSYYYLRRRSPAAPRSRPTTVRQGNSGGYYSIGQKKYTLLHQTRSQLGCELVRRYAQQRRLPLLETSEVELHPRVHLVQRRCAYSMHLVCIQHAPGVHTVFMRWVVSCIQCACGTHARRAPRRGRG